jgi:hippurate hydrolase
MTYFGLGAADPAALAAAHAAGKELPGPHTNKFQPDPEPTIATGIQWLTTVATALLQ